MKRLVLRCLLIVVVVMLAGCQAMMPPQTAKIGDQTFVMMADLVYQVGGTNESIVVPRGFVTDFASIPRALWWWQSKTDRNEPAAIVHDYLYWDQSCSKDEADAVIYLAMEDSGVSNFNRSAIFLGVHWLGDSPFAKNTAAKKRGESRFLSEESLRWVLQHPEPAAPMEHVLSVAKSNGGLVARTDPNPERLKHACGTALAFLQQGRRSYANLPEQRFDVAAKAAVVADSTCKPAAP